MTEEKVVNLFESFTRKPTDPLLGRNKPDPRKGKDNSWANLGQLAVPQELAELIAIIKECKRWPEYKTNNDIARDGIYQLCKAKEAEIGLDRYSWLIEAYERVEAAAMDKRWYEQSMSVIEMRQEQFSRAVTDERKRALVTECDKDARTLHPDTQKLMRKVIANALPE